MLRSRIGRPLAVALAACALAPEARADSRPGFAPPAQLARVYVEAGARYGVAPRLLAAIGYNESRHGRSRLPGVRSGVNRAGCCAGPAQLCVVRSCGRVWQRYRVDGDGDGRKRVHDAGDGFATAARYVGKLRKMIRSTRPRLLLAAYNAGPGAVRRYGGVPPYAETIGYVRVGKRLMRALSSAPHLRLTARGDSGPS
jgi:soluble lytic murein transglycosylase-like protein